MNWSSGMVYSFSGMLGKGVGEHPLWGCIFLIIMALWNQSTYFPLVWVLCSWDRVHVAQDGLKLMTLPHILPSAEVIHKCTYIVFNYLLWCVWECMCMGTCHSTCGEARGQPCGVGSFMFLWVPGLQLPSPGLWDKQLPLPAELSY